jgi:hypothetical protein
MRPNYQEFEPCGPIVFSFHFSHSPFRRILRLHLQIIQWSFLFKQVLTVLLSSFIITYFHHFFHGTKIIQRLQSNVLQIITNAPWYVSNYTLHNDLQIPFITEEIKRYSTLYYNRLIERENSYVTELGNPLNVRAD